MQIRDDFLYLENHRPCVKAVPKSVRYARFRRSDQPPSDEEGGFAVRRRRRERNKQCKFSPPAFCFAKASPL